MFGSRARKIRGVSGTLDDVTVAIVDAALGTGPGIMRVVAEAGAAVLASSAAPAQLDVQIGKIQSPKPVTQVAGLPTDAAVFMTALPYPVDAAVLIADVGAHESIGTAIDLSREVARSMLDRGHPGAIVFETGIERSGPKGAGASALTFHVEELAAELAPNGIRVNAVAPGPVGANRRGNPVSHRATPLGHVAVHPIEVGKAVWFLLNDDLSAGITGTTIRVDRGASLTKPTW